MEMKLLLDSITNHAHKGTAVPQNLLSRLHKTVKLLAELTQYSAPHLSSLPRDVATAALTASAKLMKRSGLSKEELDDAQKLSLRKPRGRPEIYRHLAAQAEGLKGMDSKWTWPALADHLRPEDYPVYAQSFRKRLRRDVVRLRNLLRRIDSFLKQGCPR
jgi:hypothetical protein